MQWSPWDTHKVCPPDLLGIDAPPCSGCKFWRPQARFVELREVGMQWDGVVCCHTEHMEHDFSCFRPAKP